MFCVYVLITNMITSDMPHTYLCPVPVWQSLVRADLMPPTYSLQNRQHPTVTLPHHMPTVLRPFFRDHLGEPVPEENFQTLRCKGRLTEADTPTIRLDATPSCPTSAHLHHQPFFTGPMPFLPPNQQRQSTEGQTLK